MTIFEEEEIKEAVWDCGSLKSPGSDGFNFKFIKSFWILLKNDVYRSAKEFHRNEVLPRGVNSTFIILIPKVIDPLSLKKFRPISLVGLMYKILAKRLAKVLPKIIDECQSAFLSERSLLHSALVANEVVEEVKRRKGKCVIFKVDYEKAYGLVNWEFLLYMMRRLGFCTKWVNWIKECLASGFASILVNESPTSEFKMEKDLRQGDSLAPFLFTMVAEGLSVLMREAMEKNMFKGVLVGEKKVEVNLLQYADDIVFFGETNLRNARTIKCLMRSFELVSGLKVNFAKKQFCSYRCGGKVCGASKLQAAIYSF